MSEQHDAPEKRRGSAPAWIIAFIILAGLVVGGVTYFASTDRATPVNIAGERSPETETPTTETSSASESPQATAPTDGPFAPDAQETYQVDGEDANSLPAYEGSTPATEGPLGLGCGGAHPTILYKTETKKYRTSLCSTTPSGEDIRMVTQRKSGGEAVDMTAEYVPGLDSFVAKKAGRKYVVEAYDGTLTISKSGKVESREEAVDYQSLDNEPDGD